MERDDASGRPPVQSSPDVQLNLPALPEGLLCERCGYDVRGLTCEQCPECGQSLVDLREGGVPIPWERRREIGRFRAYWRTRDLIRFHSRAFWNAAAVGVRYRDARFFQLLTVTIVTACFAAVVGSGYLFDFFHPQPPTQDPFGFPGQFAALSVEDQLKQVLEPGWPLLGVGIGLAFWLLAITAIPSYFFHPPSIPMKRQNSGIALSYYAAASATLWLGPVMLLPLFVLLAGHDVLTACTMYVVFGGVAILLALYDVARLARRMMPGLRGRSMLLVFVLPPIWIALGLLLMVGLPAVIIWIYVVFASLG